MHRFEKTVSGCVCVFFLSLQYSSTLWATVAVAQPDRGIAHKRTVKCKVTSTSLCKWHRRESRQNWTDRTQPTGRWCILPSLHYRNTLSAPLREYVSFYCSSVVKMDLDNVITVRDCGFSLPEWIHDLSRLWLWGYLKCYQCRLSGN